METHYRSANTTNDKGRHDPKTTDAVASFRDHHSVMPNVNHSNKKKKREEICTPDPWTFAPVGVSIFLPPFHEDQVFLFPSTGED